MQRHAKATHGRTEPLSRPNSFYLHTASSVDEDNIATFLACDSESLSRYRGRVLTVPPLKHRDAQAPEERSSKQTTLRGTVPSPRLRPPDGGPLPPTRDFAQTEPTQTSTLYSPSSCTSREASGQESLRLPSAANLQKSATTDTRHPVRSAAAGVQVASPTHYNQNRGPTEETASKLTDEADRLRYLG